MKAKEAPENIYVALDTMKDDNSTLVLDHPIHYPICTKYTRTDAFIEKACEWIKKNLLNHTYVYEEEVGIGMAVFLEEFKQAMKGE